MKIKNVKRSDIHLVATNSNLSEAAISKALKEKVYHNKEDWQNFLQLFLISLGVGFSVAGIVFFFAYNWEDLHKFVKIGLIEGLLIVTTFLVLHPKISLPIRNLILTGASVLVGVLFAVFGQIYQTGANTYDFFLVWSVFVTLWVLVSKYPPLWLLYLILINTTVHLYADQVASDWSYVFVSIILFTINTAVLISAIFLAGKRTPNWFLTTIALASVSYATIGMVNGIYEEYQSAFLLLILITAIAFPLGFLYGLKTKNSFYLSIIPFSLIIIVSALIMKTSEGEISYLMMGFFIIGSVTLTIRYLMGKQKKWINDR